MANNKKTNYINPYRRTRSYLQIIYPKSAPSDFLQQLEEEVKKGKLRAFILSPLHNLDKYDAKAANESFLRAQSLIAQAINEIDKLADAQIELLYNQYIQFALSLNGINEKAMKNAYANYEKIRSELLEKTKQQKDQKRQEIIKENTHNAGDPKEEHYHLDVEFPNTISQSRASDYLQSITNGTIAIAREKSLKAQVRYMAHLDEDLTKKAFYDPSQIYAYGIKIDKYFEDEDKSMNSTMAWRELRQLIICEEILDMDTFEEIICNQDIGLQCQVQTNLNLRSRCKDLIYARAQKASQDKARLETARIERNLAMKEARLRIGKFATTEATLVEANRIYEKDTGKVNGIMKFESVS